MSWGKTGVLWDAIYKFIGAVEFINRIPRYCLWLQDVKPSELRQLPLVMQRVQAVKAFRLASKRKVTNDLAATPTQFAFVSHPNSRYLLIPSVSSERRSFIPIGFIPPKVITSNLCLLIPHAKLFDFGILSSTMHNAWMRTVCGRLKSDFTVFAFDEHLRKRLRTSNVVERLNREIRRRTKVASMFPNEASCLRLVTAVVMKISEDWVASDRCWLSMKKD